LGAADELLEMVFDLREDVGWHDNAPPPGSSLGRSDAQPKCSKGASTRQFDVGPGQTSELWRFKCRCGATPVAHPDRLLARVKETVARRRASTWTRL